MLSTRVCSGSPELQQSRPARYGNKAFLSAWRLVKGNITNAIFEAMLNVSSTNVPMKLLPTGLPSQQVEQQSTMRITMCFLQDHVS